MPITQADYDIFSGFVADSTRSTERECQQSLHYAQDMLFPVTVISFDPIAYESRSHYGDSDFCVCAEVRADGGGSERQLSIWELKSPQSIIMELDDNANRWRPTKALIKAETQLLHYHYQAQQDGAFHRRFDVRPEDILPGGIVMGRDSSWCQAAGGLREARRSHAIRASYFYKPYGFRFFTWSRVLEHLDPRQTNINGFQPAL
jgi:hypothetical protein